MSMLRSLLAALVVSVLSTSVAVAQGDTRISDAVDLAAVMRLVHEVSPRLELERQGIAQAQADRITAGAYPNPTVSYGRFRHGGGQATVFEGSRQQETAVELPLLIAGQRPARIERAEREIETAQARVAAGASTLAAEAGAAFVALLAAQEKAALLSAANDEVARLRAIVAGRQAGGAATRYDVARVDVELGVLRAKSEEAQADVADRSGNLAALLGLPDWRPMAVGPLQPLKPVTEMAAAAGNRAENTPAVTAAMREETAAQSGIAVARSERWPVPAVMVGRTWTSAPFGAANFLGMTVEIPLLDTRRGPLARAEADARAATLRRQLVTAELTANLQRLEGVIVSRQAALGRFGTEAAARLGPLRRMAEDAYRLGRGTILELIDAIRSYYELRQIHADLNAGVLEAQVRLLALRGELVPAVTPP